MQPKPDWLKVRMPGGAAYAAVKARARGLHLNTVCEEAHCPNVGECWGHGTATFMVMGDTCTRACRFCAVNTAKHPDPLDPDEPARLAEAVARMGLGYVVLTCVDRDDLPDQGAAHLAACVRAVRALRHEGRPVRVELLGPDFRGERAPLETVLAAEPDVFAHNVECVARLTPRVRDPRAGYRQSLDVLAAARELRPGQLTKSSIMVGLGETEEEVVETMRDLRAVGCDFLTLGQYLRPSRRHLPVEAWITPEQFARYERIGLDLGFRFVASGPLVRSSYRAAEFFVNRYLQGREDAAGLEASP